MASFLPSLCSKVALARWNLIHGKELTYLKPKQIRSLISYLVERTDTLAVLPTGYGKSIIFELLPDMWRALAESEDQTPQSTAVIVLSPLNSILHQQSERLGTNCLLVENPTDSILSQLKQGRCTFLLGHPEHITDKKVLDILSGGVWQSKKVFLVVDEAHCVVQWGPEFRPAFLEIIRLRAVFPDVKILALTATASKEMAFDISRRLYLKEVSIVRETVDRANIKIVVKRRPATSTKISAEESVEKVLQPLVAELKDKKEDFPKTIVYAVLKWCGHGHEMAVRDDIDGSPSDVKGFVAQYHKPCTQKMKQEVGEAIQSGTVKLVFATEAYSMGTDVKDIRRVVHVGPPKCLETYLQEIGRAGRDGDQAVAMLYFNMNDISKAVTSMSEDMREFCMAQTCRRQFLCKRFDSWQVTNDRPDHLCCDLCEKVCHCSLCSGVEMEEEVPQASGEQIDRIEETILAYFKQENQISEHPTGLTSSLAHRLAVVSDNIEGVKNLKDAFELSDAVASNVWIIIQCFRSH